MYHSILLNVLAKLIKINILVTVVHTSLNEEMIQWAISTGKKNYFFLETYFHYIKHSDIINKLKKLYGLNSIDFGLAVIRLFFFPVTCRWLWANTDGPLMRTYSLGSLTLGVGWWLWVRSQRRPSWFTARPRPSGW